MTESEKIKTSVTGVMNYCKSPAHFKWFNVDKRYKDTKAMIEGRLLHLAVFEPEKFSQTVVVDGHTPENVQLLKTKDEIIAFISEREKIEGLQKMKKDELVELCRSFCTANKIQDVLLYEEFKEQMAEKTVINQELMEKLELMRNRVLEHRFCQRYIDKGECEVLLSGEIEGVQIRGRLDHMAYNKDLDQYIIMDLKKCRNSERFAWERTVFEEKYFIQAWLYTELIKQNFGKDSLYVYMPIEGTAPYICEAYAADDGQLDAGEQLARKKLQQLKISFKNNYWPGYTDGNLSNSSLPSYGFDRVAAQVEI